MASIGNLNAKITADAKQFVSEFARADNAARRSAAKIDREVGNLTRNIKRKFSASDIGKDLMRGLGIGSGFQAAQMAADAVVGIFEARARAAEAFATAAERAADALDSLFKSRRTDEQNVDALAREIARKQREIDALLQSNTEKVVTFDARGGRIEIERVVGPSDENKTAAENLKAEIWKLTQELERLQKTVNERAAKTLADDLEKAADQARKLGPDLAALKEITPDDEARAADELRRFNEEIEKLAHNYAELVDPTLKYKEQLEEIEFLMRMLPERADEWAAAGDKVRAEWAKAEQKMEDLSKTTESGSDSFEKVQTAAEAMTDATVLMLDNVGDRAAQTFADMVLTGKASFGDLVDIVARSVIEMVARLAIINPILNGMMGMMGFSSMIMPAFWGAGAAAAGAGAGAAASAAPPPGGLFADGGRPPLGRVSIVGEQGPELFIPDQAGTIIPHGKSKALLGGGGDTYYIDARGADAAAVARLEAQIRALNGSIERRSVAANHQARRRGMAGAF